MAEAARAERRRAARAAARGSARPAGRLEAPEGGAPTRRAAGAGDLADARQARFAALVMAGAMLAWLGLQWLGSRLGWPAPLAFLIDFAALAAFIFALVLTYRIWRRGKDTKGRNDAR